MSHIFISYSRKNIEFAGRIVKALADNKLDTWVDWKSIPKGEDWWQHIQEGIEEADAFLLLISPDSIVSKICNDELNYAVQNGKRILPIIIRDPEMESVPEVLSKLNWIFCREGKDNFDKALEEIRETIHTDYKWLKFHTELQVKALKWQRSGKERSLLIRGKELDNAESLLEIKNSLDPLPVDLQREYLFMSRKAVDQQLNLITKARIRIIWPYAFLTFLVAITGIYIVTRLITSSLSERMNNQLLEAGRIVSDQFVNQEIQHIKNARIVIFTRGMEEALITTDLPTLYELTLPIAGILDVQNLLIIDIQGKEMLHLLQNNKEILNVTQATQVNASEFILSLLDNNNPDAPPARAIAKDLVDNRWYYYTAVPFVANDEMIGVIVIGTSMDTLMPMLKSTSLSDVIFYGENGFAVASSLKAQEEGIFLKTLSIPAATYQEVAKSNELVFGENITIGERSYSLALGKLQIGNDTLGVFSVVSSSDYVVQTVAINRNFYVVIFSTAMIVIVLLGFFIAQQIVRDLLASI